MGAHIRVWECSILIFSGVCYIYLGVSVQNWGCRGPVPSTIYPREPLLPSALEERGLHTVQPSWRGSLKYRE